MPAYQSGWQGISAGLNDIGNFQQVASQMRAQDQAVQTNQMQQAVHAVNLQKEQNELKVQQEEKERADTVTSLALDERFAKLNPESQKGLVKYLSSKGYVDTTSPEMTGKRGLIDRGFKEIAQDPMAFSEIMQPHVNGLYKASLEAQENLRTLEEKPDKDPQKVMEAKAEVERTRSAWEEKNNMVNSHTAKLRQAKEIQELKLAQAENVAEVKSLSFLNKQLAMNPLKNEQGEWGFMQMDENKQPHWVPLPGIPKTTVEKGMEVSGRKDVAEVNKSAKIEAKKIGGTGGGSGKPTVYDKERGSLIQMIREEKRNPNYQPTATEIEAKKTEVIKSRKGTGSLIEDWKNLKKEGKESKPSVGKGKQGIKVPTTEVEARAMGGVLVQGVKDKKTGKPIPIVYKLPNGDFWTP